MTLNLTSFLFRLHQRLASLAGWRRRFVLLAFGGCAALAMPPVYALPLLMVAYVGLQWVLNAAMTRRQRFWAGWWFGWGFFIAGNYWIAISMTVDVAQFGWLIPFTVFGLTAALAIFFGLAALLAGEVRAHTALPRAVWFACVMAAMEWVRGHILTGFPWNLPVYALSFSDAAVQPAYVLGAYGLSLLVLLAACLPAALVCPQAVHGRLSGHGIGAMSASWLLLAAAVMLGALRLYAADLTPRGERTVPDVKLRLVQANIEQHHKWEPATQMRGLQEHIQLSLLSQGLDDVTHIIWPETAVPYVFSERSRMSALLSPVAPSKGALVTGTMRAQGEGGSQQFFNSLVVLRSDGEIAASYDKHRLVPFGEFVPLRFMIPVGTTDFSRGPGPRTLDIPAAPGASPLICYEAIFPSIAVDPLQRPGWLLNITNDAWFGRSSGPYQHFAMSRLRAVEQGLPLVRVANTGITAATDAYGRVIGFIPLEQKGILDVPLYKALPPTPYAHYGDVLFAALLLIFMGISFGKIQIFRTGRTQN